MVLIEKRDANDFAFPIDQQRQFGIRGVMVDAAREYLPLSALKQFVQLPNSTNQFPLMHLFIQPCLSCALGRYVVLCRLFKLNHLHIHFSDDSVEKGD